MPTHEPGLARDLQTLMRHGAERRRLLHWLGLAGAAPLAMLSCGGGEAADDGSSGTASSGTTTTSASGTTCSVIPTETEGPYPGDGSNTNAGGVVNALLLSGIVRSDLRTSVGGASGTAGGVPLTLTLTLVDTANACTPLAGYAVYAWHCTRDGNYSLYSSGHTGENYLRGVQVTDADGRLSFTTVFPGCYSGRWPHIHFEIYRSLSAATDASTVRDYVKVSQIALPEAACRAVYGAATGYNASLSALNGVSLASDGIFADGYASQLATVSGNVTDGYAATLQVGIAA